MMRYGLGILALGLCAAAADVVRADVIVMKNGKQFDGIIQAEKEKLYVILVDDATINVPRGEIESLTREEPYQFYVRMGEDYFLNDQFERAQLSYQQALKLNPDSEAVKHELDRVSEALRLVEERGYAGLETFRERRNLRMQADQWFEQGDFDAALKNYLHLHEVQPNSPEILLKVARTYLEKTIADFLLAPEERQRLEERARTSVMNPDIRFIPETAPEQLQILTRAEEIFVPLESFKTLPLSVAVLRELHRGNENLYNLIYYIDQLYRLQQSGELMVYHPACRQWYNVVKLIRLEERQYYDNLRQLSQNEADRIQDNLQKTWEANRTREIDRLWLTVQNMVRNNQWGFELREYLERLSNLNPPQAVLDQLAHYADRNNAVVRQLEEQRRAAPPRRQGAAPGQAEVLRGTTRPHTGYNPNARVKKIDPIN